MSTTTETSETNQLVNEVTAQIQCLELDETRQRRR